MFATNRCVCSSMQAKDFAIIWQVPADAWLGILATYHNVIPNTMSLRDITCDMIQVQASRQCDTCKQPRGAAHIHSMEPRCHLTKQAYFPSPRSRKIEARCFFSDDQDSINNSHDACRRYRRQKTVSRSHHLSNLLNGMYNS